MNKFKKTLMAGVTATMVMIHNMAFRVFLIFFLTSPFFAGILWQKTIKKRGNLCAIS